MVTGCSNTFYGRRTTCILPGPPAVDGRGLGDRAPPRRRQRLGRDPARRAAARCGVAELDTTYFKGNAPGCGRAARRTTATATVPTPTLGPVARRTALQPDTRHRFVLRPRHPATHVRLDIYPDGGMARLRLWGSPTDDGLAALRDRWDATG